MRGIKISNKAVYTLLAVLVVVLASFGVHALLVPGTSPSPGHDASSISPPSGCGDGQVLQFVSQAEGWSCTDASTGSIVDGNLVIEAPTGGNVIIQLSPAA